MPSQRFAFTPERETIRNSMATSRAAEWQRANRLRERMLGEVYCFHTAHSIGRANFFARQNDARKTKWNLPGVAEKSAKQAAVFPAASKGTTLNDDAANNGRDKEECSRKQDDVNSRLNLLPRIRSALGTIELIHMRIRNTQIRHVSPPFVSYMSLRSNPGRIFIHILSIR